MALCTLVTRRAPWDEIRVVPPGCILTRFSNAVNRRRSNFVRISEQWPKNRKWMRANVCGRIKGERRYFSTRKVFQLGNRETEMHNAREKIDEDENV